MHFAHAAAYGDFTVLQWAQQLHCPWDEMACSYAVAQRQLNVLQWLRANGCSWDDETCHQAARSNHVDVLQWAYLKNVHSTLALCCIS